MTSAPVAAAVVATILGASFWIMGCTSGLGPNLRSSPEGILNEIPTGMLGGLIRDAVTSILLEFLGAHLEDHEQAS